MTWRGSTTVLDRIFASLPYLIPLLFSLPFGISLLKQFPILAEVLIPILTPVMIIYSAIPFADIVVFFLLFLLVVRNERIIHFIRFNTMQALLVEIILFLCGMVNRFVLSPLGPNLITQTLLNIVFIGTLCVCVYSVVQSLLGRYAEIPAISEASYLQVR